MATIGILLPLRPGRPLGDAGELPLGRAALRLATEGIRVIMGARLDRGVLTGVDVLSGDWSPAVARIDAAYDRFPSQTWPDRYRALLDNLDGAPLGNPPALTELCRDKVASQRRLEYHGVPMPRLHTGDTPFQRILEALPGGGFLKPRHGSFGRGVRFVRFGDRVPYRAEGAVPGHIDQMILQDAVPPLAPFAGVSVRQLVQRDGDRWSLATAAVRRHRHQKVVNHARDAEVVAGPDALSARCLDEMTAQTHRVVELLCDDRRAVELGLDFAIDDAQQPWLIEVNSRPRGRLKILADRNPGRFLEEHIEACCRPLRELAGIST